LSGSPRRAVEVPSIGFRLVYPQNEIVNLLMASGDERTSPAKLLENTVLPSGANRGVCLSDDVRSQKEHLEAIRCERSNLIEQIRRSQETIERSQELIKRIDEILTKSERKP
jgi:hypothetical protein